MNEYEPNDNYRLYIKSTDPVEEYICDSVYLNEGDYFKIFNVNTNEWYPDGMEDPYGQNSEIQEDGNYKVYFRPNGDGGEDWYYGCILVELIDQYYDQEYDVSVHGDSHGTAEANCYSAAEGTTVTLTANPNRGYIFDYWEVVTNNTTIENNSFVMPNNEVVIEAHFKIDPNFDTFDGGSEELAKAITSTDNSYFGGGYYTVDNDITFSSGIELLGDTVITIAKGKTLTVDTSDQYAVKGNQFALTVLGEGKLVVKSTNESGYGIYAVGSYTQKDCTAEITSAKYGMNVQAVDVEGGKLSMSSTCSFCVSARTVTIKDCIADFSTNYYNHLYSTQSVSLIGGQIETVKIDTFGTITLGYTTKDDFIKIGDISSHYSEVNVAEGQILTDGEGNFYKGSLTKDEINAIKGKTLRPVCFKGDGSENNPYLIENAGGWDYFCDLIKEGETFSGKTVVLGESISVTRIAGSNDKPFSGTFDGQNNTLTFNYSGAEDYIAPFAYATWNTAPIFRNLNISGTINTTGSYAAGLVGHLYGEVTIEKCKSSIEITSAGCAGGYVGLCEHTVHFIDCVSSTVIHSEGGNNSGFVGWSRASGHEINFTGCIFNGKLLQKDGNGSSNGGFIGWTGSNKNVEITNCFYASAALADGETLASGNSATFARGWNETTKASNSYYVTSFGTAQGKAAHTITAGENVTLSLSGKSTEYSVSGITAYENNRGLKYGDKLYAGNEDVVTLTLENTVPNGYTFKGYTVNAGTLADSKLTMPDEDVTVSASFKKVYTDGIGERLAGHSLSLNGNIGVNFYMELDDDVAANPDAYMHFTLPNGTTQDVTVADAVQKTVSAKKYYVFQCETAAKEMTDTITAQIFSGDKSGEVYRYTVKEYADYLFKNAYEEDGVTVKNQSYADAYSLIEAMVNYGAYSQIYFNHNTDALANDGRTNTDVSAVKADTINMPYDSSTENLPEGVTFAGANLVLESETVMNLYFTNTTGKALTFTTDDNVTLTQEQSGKYTKVTITDIAAQNLDEYVKVNVTVEGNDTQDAPVSGDKAYTVKYSPMNYCYNTLSRETTATRTDALKDVMRALYLYNQQAKTCFATNYK